LEEDRTIVDVQGDPRIPLESGVCGGCNYISSMLTRHPTPARSLLQGLEARGHIRRIAGRDQAIEVLRPVGRVAFYKFDDREKTLQPMSR
jgi:hypothetical protein